MFDSEELTPQIRKSKRMSRRYGWLIAIGAVLVIFGILALIPYVEMSVYEDKKYGIQINYPKDWKVMERPDKAPGAIVAFVPPYVTDVNDFPESVNITFHNLRGKGMDLTKFTKASVHQLTGTLGNYANVIESKPAKLSGNPAWQFMWEGKGMGSDVPSGLYNKYYHIWTVQDEMAFVITYVSTKEDFFKMFFFVTLMVKSFKIL